MSGPMLLTHATTVGLVLLTLAMLLCIVRLVRGPTLADRILALDTITVLAVGYIAVFAIRTGFVLYIDVAIAIALVGFLATVALARYLLERPRQEADRD
jgi:multicomponent Na+:H+ antiporter subunit F